MKRIFILLAAAALMLFCGSALGELIGSSEAYTDAPANSTHDNIIQISAQMLMPDQEPVLFNLMQMLPTDTTVDTLHSIYDFVDQEQLPPALYFPLLVQMQLDMILEPKGVDKEDLYMSEFMSMMHAISNDHTDIDVEMHFDIDYEPGRTVVVVLGWEDKDAESGIHWVALDASVVRDSVVSYTLPAVVAEKIHGREALFSLLTVRPGGKRIAKTETIVVEPTFSPSVSSGEATEISKTTYSYEKGEPIECEIVVAESNRRIDEELEYIQKHILEDQLPVSSYFGSHIEDHAELHLPDLLNTDVLIAYEMTCLEAIKYEETHGDVVALLSFLTPYTEDMHLVSILGLPNPEDPEGPLVWTALKTECIDGYIEIVFSSTILPQMMEDTAILLVLSSPLPDTMPTEDGINYNIYNYAPNAKVE